MNDYLLCEARGETPAISDLSKSLEVQVQGLNQVITDQQKVIADLVETSKESNETHKMLVACIDRIRNKVDTTKSEHKKLKTGYSNPEEAMKRVDSLFQKRGRPAK